MRKAIVYASVHHGNTEKIVNSIAETCRVDIENRTTIYKKENEKNIIAGRISSTGWYNKKS